MYFAHFGCWNLYDNIKIIENVIENIKKENILFLSIGGDNYYRTSNKPNDIKRMGYGFKLLPHDIMKYIVLGNHDIEYSNILEYQLSLTNQQMIFYDGPFFKKINQIIIIFIDTSIYNLPEDNKLPKSYQLLKFSKDITTVKDFIIKQEFTIKYILNTNNFENIIFIGHHPIFGVKLKKNNDKIYLLTKLRDFIFSINNKKITYIGSHIHNYQEGIVSYNNKEIIQYITGIGGAKLDNIPNNEEFNLNNTRYKIIKKIKNHGYIKVNLNNLNVDFKQIKITLKANIL